MRALSDKVPQMQVTLKFEGFESNLLKNLQGSFPSRAPGSLCEISFVNSSQVIERRLFLEDN